MDELNVVNWLNDSGKPPQPGDPNLPKPPQYCMNCGKEVPQLYCTWCGQSVKQIRVSMKSLVIDFLGDYFTFDSKLFRSLKPLFFKPGFLTTAFMRGKRATYIPPLRLYIFSSIIFFLTLNLTTSTNLDLDSIELKNETVIAPIALDASPEDLQGQLDGLDKLADDLEKPGEGEGDWRKRKADWNIFAGHFDENTWYGPYLNEKIKKQEEKLESMEYEELIPALVKAIYGTLPKGLFLLMPLFALFLKMLYIRQDPLYIDHLIFAFHTHAFLFLLYSAILLLGNSINASWLDWVTGLAGFFLPPIYLLMSLKSVYGQSRRKSVLKFVLLSGLYGASLLVFTMLILVVSIFLV